MSPPSGEVLVLPYAEVLINYHGGEFLNLKIDGEWVLNDGQIMDGFRIVRKEKIGPITQVGVRRTSGWRPGDILVQAWDEAGRSIEQRFFVKGAETKIYPQKRNFLRIFGGFHYGEGLIFAKNSYLKGNVIHINQKKWEIPSDWLSNKILLKAHDPWIMASIGKTSTKIIKPDYMREIPIASDNAYICSRYINMQISECESAHVHLNYEHSLFDDSYDVFYHNGKYDIKFGDGIHVWVNPRKMIVKHQPRAISNKSEDILWMSEDIGCDEIKCVHIVDSEHVIVNKKWFVNTRYPEVKRI